MDDPIRLDIRFDQHIRKQEEEQSPQKVENETRGQNEVRMPFNIHVFLRSAQFKIVRIEKHQQQAALHEALIGVERVKVLPKYERRCANQDKENSKIDVNSPPFSRQDVIVK
jgi:hypothetical protein